MQDRFLAPSSQVDEGKIEFDKILLGWSEGSAENIATPKNKKLISLLCNDSPRKPEAVYQCGELLRQKPPKFMIDAPDTMFQIDNQTLKLIGVCGGFPQHGSDGKIKPEPFCEIRCLPVNLCQTE